MLDTFHFLRPWWLLALLPVLVGFIWILRHHALHKTWQQVGDPVLMQHLLQDIGGKQRQYPRYLLLFTLIVSTFSLAGPAWEKLQTPLFTRADALVVVVSLSQDMNVTDLKPSRLVQVQQKLNDLFQDFRHEGQTALLVFAGDTHIVSPLTTDTQTILSLLPVLQTDLMPIKGHDIGQALFQAGELLKNAGKNQGDILFVSHDGGDKKALAQAQKLAQQGYHLSTLGIGTRQGAPVPDEQGLRKDAQGQIIFSRRDDVSLQALATAGKGRYQVMSIDNQDLNQLLPASQLNADYQRSEELQMQQQWADEGVYLLILLLPFALLAFRRGWFVLLCAYGVPLFLVLQPQPSLAFSWQDLWTPAEQQAQQYFNQGDYQQATKKFADPAWKASAYYKAGDYKKAIEYYDQLDTADAWYNKGNALAKSGQLEQASQAYAQALKHQADLTDARDNKKLVDDLLKQQQADKQKKGDNSKDQKGQQSEDSQDQEGQQSEDSQDQKGQQSEDSQDQKGQQSKDSQDQAGQQSEDLQDQKGQQSEDSQDQVGQQPEETPDQVQQQAEEQTGEEGKDGQENTTVFSTLNEEEQQAVEVFLNQIPDDPANLLRRKFYLNSQRRQQ